MNASVCRLAIKQSELFIVPDLAADGRFSDNPLVAGPPGMRFYAGALLRTSDGHALGTLCVLDHEPRPGLDEEQKAALSTLARQVMSLLELRRSIQQKDLMLKEVNHRVKNSLQLVSSLLRLESRQISDPVTRRHFDEACSRVATVARVHERLYKTDKVGVVEFGMFLRDLCADLAHSAMVEQGHHIEVEADTHELPTDKVIPLALVVNELRPTQSVCLLPRPPRRDTSPFQDPAGRRVRGRRRGRGGRIARRVRSREHPKPGNAHGLRPAGAVRRRVSL